MLKLIVLAILAPAMRADTTFVSVDLTGMTGSLTCMQTDPAQSSCEIGNPSGPSLDPPIGYALATAFINEPGVLSIEAEATGFGVADTSANAFASASFGYTVEAIGGTGQVLVAPSSSFSGCQEVSSLFGNQPCISPSWALGGVENAYVATYGVPFSFTGGASAYADPDYDEGWSGTAYIFLPISSLRLLDPITYSPVAGTIELLPDVAPTPEPASGMMLGAGLVLLMCYRRSRRKP